MIICRKLNRFNNDIEEKYREYRFPRDVISIRITGIATVIHTAFKIYEDSLFFSNIFEIALIRIFTASVLVGVVWLTYTKLVTLKNCQFIAMFAICFYAASCFFLDYYEAMPDFSLTNILILTAFVNSVGIGLFFNRSFLLNLAMLFLYFAYDLFIADHQVIRNANYFNISTFFVVASFFAFLFERESRVNFHQHLKLIGINHELDEANLAKNKILSLLSHDLNSPLRNLAGILNLRLLDGLPEMEFRQYLKKIKMNLESTIDLLSNLTRWSMTKMEGFKPYLEPLNMLALTTNVIESLEPLPQEKGITFKLAFGEHQTCVGDEEMLKHAVRNIMMNSIKFSHPNGIIEVSASLNKQHYLFTITDYGVGMSPDELNSLFTFRTKSKLGTKKELGSGLGLILTKDFIELNGGTIQVDSVKDQGTSFTLCLKKFKQTYSDQKWG